MEIKKMESIIEAILFTMGDSVEASRIAKVIEQDTATTKKIIRNMMLRYEEEDRGIRILELEDAYQMCTKKEMYEYLIQIAKQPKHYHLTDVVLETPSRDHPVQSSPWAQPQCPSSPKGSAFP